ncbi:MAG: hypothetical protein ACHP7P_12020 [Terriglobales bacterium]
MFRRGWLLSNTVFTKIAAALSIEFLLSCWGPILPSALELMGHKSYEALKVYRRMRRSAREKREAQKRAAVAAILQVEASA